MKPSDAHNRVSKIYIHTDTSFDIGEQMQIKVSNLENESEQNTQP